ncbi:hypothetical protein ACIBHY_09795 [Nonomuraea sp. NPDC050547]|uniref:hypothetical protein n=1 Tax=Nonomuraea sp. NPDC050547 TaxID=3364368 RepID=UPI0037AFFDBA
MAKLSVQANQRRVRPLLRSALSAAALILLIAACSRSVDAATACTEAFKVIDAAETRSNQQATARADTATIAKTFADAGDGLQKVENESSDPEVAKRIGRVRGSYTFLLNQAAGDGNFALPLAMVKQTVQDLRDHCKSKG